MPDPTLSDALKEAFASVPVDLVIHHTLEFSHPDLTMPVRVVRDHVDLTARLEASAPDDPAAVVTFIAVAFDVVPPPQDAAALPELTIEIDNVGQVLMSALEMTATSQDPVTVIYRYYLSGSTDDGPENDPPLRMQVKQISATPLRVSARCGFPDLLNRKFPALEYEPEAFPGLAE